MNRKSIRCLSAALIAALLFALFCGCTPKETTPKEYTPIIPTLSPSASLKPSDAEPTEEQKLPVYGILSVSEKIQTGKKTEDTGREEKYPLSSSEETIVFSGSLDKDLSFTLSISNTGDVSVTLLDGAVTAPSGSSSLLRGGKTEFTLRDGKPQEVILECESGTALYTFLILNN